MNLLFSLEEFVTNGSFMSLHGLDLKELKKAMGKPEDFSFFKSGQILKYFGGSLELTFYKERQYLIAVYFMKGSLDAFEVPSFLKNERECMLWLKNQNISYAKLAGDDVSNSWELENGVTIVFYESELESIQAIQS